MLPKHEKSRLDSSFVPLPEPRRRAVPRLRRIVPPPVQQEDPSTECRRRAYDTRDKPYKTEPPTKKARVVYHGVIRDETKPTLHRGTFNDGVSPHLSAPSNSNQRHSRNSHPSPSACALSSTFPSAKLQLRHPSHVDSSLSPERSDDFERSLRLSAGSLFDASQFSNTASQTSAPPSFRASSRFEVPNSRNSSPPVDVRERIPPLSHSSQSSLHSSAQYSNLFGAIERGLQSPIQRADSPATASENSTVSTATVPANSENFDSRDYGDERMQTNRPTRGQDVSLRTNSHGELVRDRLNESHSCAQGPCPPSTHHANNTALTHSALANASTHDKDVPKSFKCAFCDEIFARNVDLAEHLANFHVKEYESIPGFRDVMQRMATIHHDTVSFLSFL